MAKKKRNIWKLLSILFIVLFLFVVLGGVWRAYHFKHSFTKATSTQTDVARNLAISDLTNKGINTNGLAFRISDEIRKNPMDKDYNKNSTQILEVSAYNASERHMYIIDINSAKILVYSKTQFYDGLNHTYDRQINPRDPIRREEGPFRK
jgi:hypothetical protein